jgi:hypothetical protein
VWVGEERRVVGVFGGVESKAMMAGFGFLGEILVLVI